MNELNIETQDLLGLVGLIYEGPMENRPWASSLKLLKEHLNANYVTLAIRPTTFALPGIILAAGELPPTFIDAYHNQFFSIDPFVDLPSDHVVTSEELFTMDEWVGEAYFKEYLDALNIYRIMGADIKVSEDMSCPLRISRPKSLQPFDEQDKLLCNLLIPHFKRSVLIYSELIKKRSFGSLYESTIDEMMLGVIVVSEDGEVIQANNVAHQILSVGSGLSLKNNRLRAAFESDQAKLRSYLKDAVSLSVEKKSSNFEVMTINRQDGRSDLSLAIHSIPSGAWRTGGKRPAAAIFVRDPVGEIRGQVEVLSKLFELTPAEASLAIKMMNGLSLDEASEVSGIKRNTARAHLRSIFSKVGVTRQSDLIRILLNSVASFSGKGLG